MNRTSHTTTVPGWKRDANLVRQLLDLVEVEGDQPVEGGEKCQALGVAAELEPV